MKQNSKITSPKKSFSPHNQLGAAMVEYGLLVALILTVCITSVQVIGGRSLYMYNDVEAAFGNFTGQSN